MDVREIARACLTPLCGEQGLIPPFQPWISQQMLAADLIGTALHRLDITEAPSTRPNVTDLKNRTTVRGHGGDNGQTCKVLQFLPLEWGTDAHAATRFTRQAH